MTRFLFVGILAVTASLPALSIDSPTIASWDTVPDAYIQPGYKVGVIAYNYYGINKVRFFIDDDKIDVEGSSFNQSTGSNSYFAEVNRKYCQRDTQINASIHAKDGTVRYLSPITLHCNKAERKVFAGPAPDGVKKYKDNKIYSLSDALDLEHEIDTIELISPGRYDLSHSAKKITQRKGWLTIRGASAHNRNDYVLTLPERQLVRLKINKIKFENVSLDFAGIQQIYLENDHVAWFDNVRWFDSNGNHHRYKKNSPPVRTSKYSGGYYATNSVAENMTYGFVDANIAANVTVRNISGDAFQNSRVVFNSVVDGMDHRIKPEIHSDVFQYYGHFDGVYVQNVKAMNLYNIQNIFFDHVDSSFANMVFENISFENISGNPPFSQVNSKVKNLYLVNVKSSDQSIYFRDDMTDGGRYEGENIVFKCSLFKKVVSRRRQFPQGLVVENTACEK